MQKILNQEEIDALFRAAQKGQISPAVSAGTRKNVTKFDAREIGQINQEQVRSLSALHESFARNITNSLGAYLRVGLEVNLVSVEQLDFSEVVSRMPDMTYLCSMRLLPLEAIALLQMDLALAFPIMDLVLGGSGQGAFELRDLTEIEEQILESVVQILARELQAAWAAVLEVEFRFDQRQQNAQVISLMPPTERTLTLNFEIKMPDAHGILNVTFAAVASNALLRKLAAQFSYYKHAGSLSHVNQLRERMLDAQFPVELKLPEVPVRVREMSALQPGQVLPLHHPLDRPGILSIGGREMFQAYPVACGALRGGQILQRTSVRRAAQREDP